MHPKNVDSRHSYRYPLPIVLQDTYNPLLPTIPSLISHLCAYYLNHVRPKFPKTHGIYDSGTQSVWIVDADEADLLWRRGFFGRGNLSRSEPSWLRRRIKQLNGQDNEAVTLEEITAKRRRLRREMKKQRAQEQRAALFGLPVPEIRTSNKTFMERTRQRELEEATARVAGQNQGDIHANHTKELEEQVQPSNTYGAEDVENLEVLVLTLQDAFFLMFGLGVLEIMHESKVQDIQNVWKLFISISTSSSTLSRPISISYDNDFIIKYVAYHHYRSLGWVVRNGVKFAVDFLLYRRGPVYQHAEYAVMVLSESRNRKKSDLETNPWHKLTGMNRVITQVKKTFIICYVVMPTEEDCSQQELESPNCLQKYSIREVSLTRFVPNRNRD